MLCIIQKQGGWPCCHCNFEALDHKAVHSHLVTFNGLESRGSSQHVAYLQLHQLLDGLCMAFLAGSREDALLPWDSQPPVATGIVIPDSDADPATDADAHDGTASPAGPLRHSDDERISHRTALPMWVLHMQADMHWKKSSNQLLHCPQSKPNCTSPLQRRRWPQGDASEMKT